MRVALISVETNGTHLYREQMSDEGTAVRAAWTTPGTVHGAHFKSPYADGSLMVI